MQDAKKNKEDGKKRERGKSGNNRLQFKEKFFSLKSRNMVFKTNYGGVPETK